MKHKEVTTFAKGGSSIASLCKIGYFTHRIFGIFLLEIKDFTIRIFRTFTAAGISERGRYFCGIAITHLSRLVTKPTKWVCPQWRLRSVWASPQSDQSLRCPHEETLVLSYPLSAQRRLWPAWADAQADLSLRWAHTHFVGFVMLCLILIGLFITKFQNVVWPTKFQPASCVSS